MKKIVIRNTINVFLGDDAYLTIEEEADGWNIKITEFYKHMVRVGMPSEDGISYQYARDLLNIDKNS